LELFEEMKNEYRTNSKAVFVYDLDGILKYKFKSLGETGKVLQIDKRTIKKHAESNEPFRDQIFSFTEK
jgi:hypothetical protein